MASTQGRESLWLALGLLAIGAVILAQSIPSGEALVADTAAAPASERPLAPGVSQERRLPPGETHLYHFSLRQGDLLHVVAAQEGVDVALTLFDPFRAKVVKVDSPNGDRFSESLLAVAPMTGLYHLLVNTGKGSSDNLGKYRLSLQRPRPATPRDRVRAAAAQAFAEGEEMRRHKAWSEALKEYGLALQGWERAGDREQQGETFYRLGWVHQDMGELTAARDCYLRALPLLGLRGDAGMVRNRLGRVYDALGQRDEAKRILQPLLSSGNSAVESAALNNLGLLYGGQGEAQEAIELLEGALPKMHKPELRQVEAWTESTVADLYLELGDIGRALDASNRARQLHHAVGNASGEAKSLLTRGILFHKIGWTLAALGAYGDAFALAQRGADTENQVRSLLGIAEAHLDGGDLDQALSAIEQAQEAAKPIGTLGIRANLLATLGRFYQVRRDPGRALALLAESEALYRSMKDPWATASILYGKANVLAESGRLEEARDAIEQSLQEVESLRSQASNREFRTSLLLSRADYYALYIEILLRLHRLHPWDGYGAQAFAASERLRTRTLLDELVQVYARSHRRPPPQRLDRRPVGLAELQNLLDGDTAVLAYTLQKDRSVLWLVERGSLEIFDLPPRAVIEIAARRAYRALAGRSPSPAVRQEREKTLSRLSELVIAPAAAQIEDKNLLVIADGAPRSIPFATLPDPGVPAGPPQPLMVRHTIVSIPSASIAVLLRTEAALRQPAALQLAVLYDPVFRPDDLRLPGGVFRRAAVLPEIARLKRLSYSHQEAQAILRLLPPEQRLEARGFDANLGLLRSPALRQLRVLHLSTHNLVDDRHPELSGVVLSQFDQEGHPRNGFLRSGDIDGLDLPVELVTLSACRTALEPKLRGEGVSGLTRGFLNAGALRVLVSLWDVDDHATAELMARFYRGLFAQGLPPAEALRAAQIEMARSPLWASPYFWAGFVLQGDWS